MDGEIQGGENKKIIAHAAFSLLHNGLSDKAQHTTMELCVVVLFVFVFVSKTTSKWESERWMLALLKESAAALIMVNTDIKNVSFTVLSLSCSDLSSVFERRCMKKIERV